MIIKANTLLGRRSHVFHAATREKIGFITEINLETGHFKQIQTDEAGKPLCTPWVDMKREILPPVLVTNVPIIVEIRPA